MNNRWSAGSFSLVPVALLSVLLVFSPLARAEVTQRDLQVASRALGFMEPPFTGTLRLGIVHAPDRPVSNRQARQIESTLSSGLSIGNITLTPVLVPLSEVGGANVDLFLLTGNLGDDGSEQFRDAWLARGIPCLTMDIDQVRAGNCLLGIRSSPKVEILLNSQMADRIGVTFASVFKMMIVEL